MSFKIIELQDSNWQAYQTACLALESNIEYPLAEDKFTINHGADYFAFFRRLGKLRFFIALSEENTLAGVIAAVKRPAVAASLANAWYIADLKVMPKFRNLQLPKILFAHLKTLACEKNFCFYGVCMDEANGHNKVVPMLKRSSQFPLDVGPKLSMYNLNAKQMQSLMIEFQNHNQPIGFLSLQGKKDLILQSTQRALPLLHVQSGPFAEYNIQSPKPNYAHLICLPGDHWLLPHIHALGIALFASATPISYGIQTVNWGEVLTSDI